MGEPHIWLSGWLSDKTSFRVVIDGDVGLREVDRLIRKLTIDRNILAGTDTLVCMDCGLPYADEAWADFVISDEAWRLICPEDNGVLCVTCMIRRAAAIPFETEGRFTSGPFADHNWRKPPQ